MTDVLAGFTVAITAERQRDEIATLLEEHGARVVVAPALRIMPLADDARLRAATSPCSTIRPTSWWRTRAWACAAGWRPPTAGGSVRRCATGSTAAYLVARSPKARAAMIAVGFTRTWSPESDSGEDLLDHLVQRGAARRALTGRRVAVQLHGEPQEEFCGALAAVGADVIEVPVYRWAPPADPTPLQRLVDLITNRLVDAVTFSSAPAVHSLLRAAGSDADAVLDALRGDVLAGCVGPVTAAPLRRHAYPCSPPPGPGSARWLGPWSTSCPAAPEPSASPARSSLCAGTPPLWTGNCSPLPPAQMAVLRALAAQPGKVLARAELLDRAAPRSRRARRRDGRGPAEGGARRVALHPDRGQARLPPPGGVTAQR